MEFRNLTPFPALCFPTVDTDDQDHRTTVMRVTYILEPVEGVAWRMILQEEAPTLRFEDQFEGEMNQSSVLEECDLAPWKPNCDVIINGSAHAPAGKAMRSLGVTLSMHAPGTQAPLPPRPQGLNPLMEPSREALLEWERDCAALRSRTTQGAVLLDKRLTVTGPREWRKRSWPSRLMRFLVRVLSLGLVNPNPWKLTRPEPFTTLPVRYEHAFGGECRIHADDPIARRVPRSARLTPEDAAARVGAEGGAAEPLVAHAYEPGNPIGAGYAPGWYLKATGAKRLPAPRISHPSAPPTAAAFWRVVRGRDATPAMQPAGFGFVGRSWQPRIALAGTWDAAWVQERHPGLPKDFDFGYWNGAPADQQIPYPPVDAVVTLTHLTPEGVMTFSLPGHRAFLACRWMDGTVEPEPMVIDTLIIDSDAKRVTVVWRAVLPEDADLRVLEARFEVDPAKPLLTWAQDAASHPVDEEVA